MPSEEVLTACNRANPHGFGFVSETDFYKGFDFNQLLDRLSRVPDNENCIIHFRLATHGSVRRSNCHPFNHGDVYFAHNGILDIRPYKDKTDSQTAFEKYIYPCIETYGLESDELRYTVSRIIGGSKFAIMQGGDIRLFGDFTRRDDGCLYSNRRFETFLSLYQRWPSMIGTRAARGRCPA